jgi:hypothetical protein
MRRSAVRVNSFLAPFCLKAKVPTIFEGARSPAYGLDIQGHSALIVHDLQPTYLDMTGISTNPKMQNDRKSESRAQLKLFQSR